MKALDLTNQHFGKLIAIQRAPKRNDKYTRWVCQCECGNLVEIRTDYLTSGHTTSCGCEKALFFQKKNLTGQRFGKLVVIADVGTEEKKCQCDCGNISIVKTYNLINGNTQSCGCLKSKGELKINQILTENLISYKTQYSFDDCRFPDTNRLAYFDYAIFHNDKLYCLIEYDGSQHFMGWGQSQKSLEQIQQYDTLKTNYCQQKKIPLIRIPYFDYPNITIDYLLKKMKEAQEEVVE